jgi:tetratricopeptide (TPR) repeat protein
LRIAAIDDEAEKLNEYNTYLQEYPNCHLGCFLMASWANDRNNFHTAIEFYTRAINILPGWGSYYYNRGNAYFKLGNLSEALADYSRAIECDAFHADRRSDYLMKSHCNRGSIYQQMGLFDKAASDFRMAVQYDPRDYISYFNLGNCLMLEGKYEESIESYTNAIGLKQHDCESYHNRAMAYLRMGKTEEAEKDLMKAEELSI